METEPRHLLNEVERICKHYDEVRILSGEGFNIFSVLRIESMEIGTHTRLLAELLNPKGSHGVEDTFLKLFIDTLTIKDFDPTSATAKAEVFIGPKTEDTGGRIDIVISDGNKRNIFLENKIYASDQENQLLRYHNHDPSAPLFYLTLNGDEPSGYSIGSGEGQLPKDVYRCISYKYDILAWLFRCRKEAASLPILRETITQYINLIKTLTNQNLSTKMNDEIVNLAIRSNESLNAFFTLLNAKEPVYNKILAKFKTDAETLATSMNMKLVFDVIRDGKDSSFTFANTTTEQYNITIAFEFEGRWTQNLVYGFKFMNQEDKFRTPPTLKERFQDAIGESLEHEWWPCYAPWHERWGWSNETYKDVLSGKFVAEVKEKITQLLGILESSQENNTKETKS